MRLGIIRERFLGYILIFMTGIIWGAGGFFILNLRRFGAEPSLIAFSNHFMALFPMAIFLVIKKGWRGLLLSRKGFIYSIFLGIFTKGILKLANDVAVTLVGAGTTTILVYTAPVFAAILSILIFKDRIRVHQKIALFLNLLACILMITGGNFKSLRISGLGLLLGILAAFLYACSTVLGKIATSGDDPITMSFYMLFFSALTLLFFAQPWKHMEMILQPQFLLWAGGNALLNGMLGNIFFLKGISLGVDTSKVTIIASVEVIVSISISVLLLDEHINYVSIFGVFLLLFSIVLMNTKFQEVVKVEEVSEL